METQKFDFFFLKSSKFKFRHSMKTQKFEFFSKKFEIRILTCDKELKSP